jgi:hypothetical protein
MGDLLIAQSTLRTAAATTAHGISPLLKTDRAQAIAVERSIHFLEYAS